MRYTRELDTRVVLTLLVHANPRRVLEIGTAFGHMTANLCRWSGEDALVFTIDLVRGVSRTTPGAVEQEVEVPAHSDWGRFANHFGTAHKALFIMADTMRYDFGRIAPIEFAFIDGAHDLEHVLNDSRKVYEALTPGGWLVWHDFNSPVPQVKVREAIENTGFVEPVVHVEGTEVAFLRKGDREGALTGGRRPAARDAQAGPAPHPPTPPFARGGFMCPPLAREWLLCRLAWALFRSSQASGYRGGVGDAPGQWPASWPGHSCGVGPLREPLPQQPGGVGAGGRIGFRECSSMGE